ncbi:FecR family protein [Gaetbulibacter saemankumensis]|uniref:FecR family protein n=1 Tax=Gaetbulibacter saemankumensis TaxID=311208 RepID=UPI0003FAEF34|nr:FecR family protein [Gaetbulibacter saemankumensis]
MNRENLISKWLNNDLNDLELEAFKKLEDYDDLMKLNNSLQNFKADTYDTTKELDAVLLTIKTKKANKSSWLKPIMRIAAVLAVCFGLYYYTTTLDTTITTEVAEKTMIELPDASFVNLNAKSVLAFNKSSWKSNREVDLDGEAFFKVAKGSSFKVKTKVGIVTVYGTEFNVKQRNEYFEVICYEGLVGVTLNSKETKLKPGDSFLIIDGKQVAKEKEIRTTPSWINNESSFKSIPYGEVISEFERQYGVNIKLENIDRRQLFTGNFTHDSLEVALKSIALGAQISRNNKTITLKRE